MNPFKGTTAQVLAAITASEIGTVTKVTITDNLYTIANLNTIIGATNNLPVVLQKTAASIPFNDVAAGILTAIAGVNNYTGAITLTGNTSAADLNNIAKGTTGKVTATLDPTTTIDALTVAALNGVKTTDNITFKPAGPITVSGNSDLTALINLKKLLPNADFTNIDTILGTQSDVALIKSAQKLAADDADVTITGQISAADANAIAKATDGALTAEIKSGSVAATLKALADVDGTIDDITFTTTDKTVNARDLVKLNDKIQTPGNFDVTSIETITENAKDVGVDAVNVTAALGIADVDVKITGTISATTADIIATAATTGVVTATIAAGTASNLLTALTAAGVNAYTITLAAGTAEATDLTDLDAKTSVAVNANAISKITGTVVEIEAAYDANANKRISGLGNEAVEITGAGDAAADVNRVLKLTTGVVTAIVNGNTAAGLVNDLVDAKATDALTLVVTAGSAAAADLIALDGKASVALNVDAVTTITGTAAEVKKVYAATGIATQGDEAVILSGTVSAADANTITGATTGAVTATVAAGTAAALNKALVNANGTPVTGDNLTLTISKGTAAAADLIALDGKTLVNVNANAVTTITGSAANVQIVLGAAGIDTATDVAATLSGTVAAADADAVADLTTGVVTATIAAGTAAALNGVLNDTAPGLKDNAYTLTVNNAAGDAAAATVLNALDAKTSVKVKVDAVEVDGAYADLEKVYVTNKAGFANLGDEKVEITDVGGVTADKVNVIAKATKGVVTATVIANTADVLVANLKDASATDALTLTVNGASAKAADLNTLDGKTSEDIVVNALNVTGNIADLTKLYITNADNFTASLGDETVEISGTVTAAQADSIADKTTAAVTANIAAATAASLNAALVDATAGANAYTLTVNGATASAATLELLNAKTSKAIKVDAKEITGSITEATAVYVTNAADYTNLGNKNVVISPAFAGTATVGLVLGNLDAILNETTGIVTATLTSDSATDLLAATTRAISKDALTLTLDAGVESAANLLTLDGRTSVTVNASAVTGITGSAADIKTVLAAKTITKAADVEATVSGVISAADANTISKATTGAVTATVAAGTAAALKSALAGVSNDDNDALTLTVTGTTAAAADLIALDAKTSVDVEVNATTITGNIADVTKVLVTDVANFANLGDETVTISGTVSAGQANAIANATTGAVTATITAGIASDLNTALANATAADALKLTVNGETANATVLNALDGKTSVTVNAAAIKNIEGTATAVKAAYDANALKTISGLGNETVDLSAAGDANVSLVKAINDYTTGVITLDTVNVSAGNFSLSQLGDLKGITGLAEIDADNSVADNITISIKDLLAANDSTNSFAFDITGGSGDNDTVTFNDFDGWTQVETTPNTLYTFTNNTNSQVITINLTDATVL